MTKKGSLQLISLSMVVTISMFVLPRESVTATHHRAFAVTAGSAIADGAAVYGSRCVICHGKDGAGLPNWRSKGQPDFTKAEWQKSHTDQQIADSIRDGKGKFMPSFKGKISDEEITAVVQHIRAFSKGK